MDEQPKGRTVKPDGDAIRSHRIARGLSVEALAKKIGRSVKTIENAERGKEVYLETLRQIASALGATFSSLAFDAPPEPPRPKRRIVFNIAIEMPDGPLADNDVMDFMKAVKRMLGGGNMEVTGIEEGSTIITVEMDDADAVSLFDHFLKGDLYKLNVMSISAVDTQVRKDDVLPRDTVIPPPREAQIPTSRPENEEEGQQ